MRRQSVKSIVISLVFSLFFLNADAGLTKKKSSVSNYEVYKSMLAFNEEEDSRKLKEALEYIKPFIIEIEKKFGADIEKRIRSFMDKGIKSGVQEMILKLIFLDIIQSLSKYSLKELISPRDLQNLIKIIYLKYLLISNHKMGNRFAADQKIKKFCQQIYQVLSPNVYSPSSKKSKIDVSKKLVEELKRNFFLCFPELKADIPC